MMNSNAFSRLMSKNPTEPSIYEDLRAQEEGSDGSDLEARIGMRLDEENLAAAHEYELDHDAALSDAESRITTESTAFLGNQGKQGTTTPSRRKLKEGKSHGRSKFMTRSPRMLEEDLDDDVPASLLIEGDNDAGPSTTQRPAKAEPKTRRKAAAVPGPSTRETRARWETVQTQQRLHQDDEPRRPAQAPVPKATFSGNTPRERALWTWVNVMNIDGFMREVYEYYRGAGIWCICLDRLLGHLTTIFVAAFVTFLTQCVDYKAIPNSKKMADIQIPRCVQNMSGMPNLIMWLFSLYTIWKVFQHLIDVRRLMRMQNFYEHLLNIPNSDMQTISWQDVVARLMALRDANPITAEKFTPAQRNFLGTQSKERLDAHDIANRLMRRENYLIALINKDILDLTLPLPFLRNRQLFSRTLEWNIHYCILDFIFTEQGQVRQLVLKDSHRKKLSAALKSRFLFAGFMNVIFAPIIFSYLLIVYFFKYFNEYQKNPSAIGACEYTPLAQWKFREFNELEHLFERRINMSYPFANRYQEQFPKVKTVQLSQFIAFVAGALVSVLALVSIIDPDLFLGFEISHDRTVLFYLGVIGTIWAVAKGAIPDDNLVFDPEYALRQVIDYTHYMPAEWKDRLHSDQVKKEFSELYKMRVINFLEELLSIIFTPFVLWFSLPKCSDQIIDFFREFTIHVDGLGYVCSFAVFDFKKGVGTGTNNTNNEDVRDDYYSTKNGKMAASFYGFMDNYATNPKTGIPLHIPPGTRRQFHPPPAFPGLMSPTLATDMQASSAGRARNRTSAAPGGMQPTRTPCFAPSAGPHASPMPSILLDPHHQPSTSGFGGRSTNRASRSRYQSRHNVMEDPIEDDEYEQGESQERAGQGRAGAYDAGLGESRWETSATRGVPELTGEENEGDDAVDGNRGGVLGLLYQFQKAQTDGRGPGVHI